MQNDVLFWAVAQNLVAMVLHTVGVPELAIDPESAVILPFWNIRGGI